MGKNAVFYGEFENEQKKDKTIFDLPERGLNPRFSVIFRLII
jgi:hypothetical protein